MTKLKTYPLRLPRSVKAEVERRATQDGISINQFVATVVAEKLAAMSTAEFLMLHGNAWGSHRQLRPATRDADRSRQEGHHLCRWRRHQPPP
jgi:hypothetical protein